MHARPTRTGARGGVEIDLGEKFTGEVSAGWINENIDDDRLALDLRPVGRGRLDWSPVRGTNVGLDVETIVEDSTTPGESGSILYSARSPLRASCAPTSRPNSTSAASASATYTGNDGEDFIWNVEGGMTWWLNRYLGLTGKARHEGAGPAPCPTATTRPTACSSG